MSDFDIPAHGEHWLQSSLIWGESAGRGDSSDSHSPFDHSLVQRVSLLSDAEQYHLLYHHMQQASPFEAPLVDGELGAFAQALYQRMRAMQSLFVEACHFETGFSHSDCEELQCGTLDYIEGFAEYLQATNTPSSAPQKYFDAGRERHIELKPQPWGAIAIVLPQNAAVLVGVVALLNALATGNRVILRPPLQCARSSALLAHAIGVAALTAPSVQSRISVVMTRARSFLQQLCQAPLPALIHYMGSSDHVPSLLADAWAGGKNVIADGSGNTWVWVGPQTRLDDAVSVLCSGALRYNGQTCTSINGAIIHPDLYDNVRERLLAHWQTLRTSTSPGAASPDTTICGPLFDEKQAAWCREQLENSGGTLLCGGGQQGNLLAPALLEHPRRESSLVSDGVFGPALWITRGDADLFKTWWMSNRYPLCAGVLGATSQDDVVAMWPLNNLARLVVNGDPSVEHIYEPWGGYAASGFNLVSAWLHKYSRTVSIDTLALSE
ncbi:MAG: hypothetical protein JWN98_812 [Abditibacteriota bacterium]|nr:hypothetical protein [Abditibacteriota bacterium]